MQEKDSKSNQQPLGSEKPSLKDTILKLIEDSYLSQEDFWEKIGDSDIVDYEERKALWNKHHKEVDQNRDLDQLKKRIFGSVYGNSYKRYEERIKENTIEMLILIDELASDLRMLVHDDDCEDPDGCPSGHEICAGGLNIISPQLWITNQLLEQITRDLRDGVVHNPDSPLGVLFCITKARNVFETIFDMAGLESYLDQHEADAYRSYQDIRGLSGLESLRHTQMRKIRDMFHRIGISADSIAAEIQSNAETWKSEEQSE